MYRRGIFLVVIFLLPAFMTVSGAACRVVADLNFGWRFHAGDVENAHSPNLDDSDWRIVDVPHDFQIEQPWVEPDASERPDNSDPGANIRSRLSSRGFKEMGKGWYRLHFKPSDSLRGRRLLLQFDGIMLYGDVYLNGEKVGETHYGYVGFEIDVTDKLFFDEDNVVAVLADTGAAKNSRWYTGGGLFRSVRLLATDKSLYFVRHPLRITTRYDRRGDDNSGNCSVTGYVSVTVEYANQTGNRESRMVVSVISPAGLTLIADTVATRRMTPSHIIEACLPEMVVENARLWDIDSPQLYKLRVALLHENGTLADEYEERFGIRKVEIGPDFGLKLNGRKVLLKGIANHHSLGALGAAAYPRAIEKRLRLLKQFGVNHIRTSHNPYSREFIELCDEMGLLVVDELYDKWTRQYAGGRVPFEQLWQSDVVEWVKRDRNSPSVVLWSFGNELQQNPNLPYNDFGVTMYKLMRTLLERYDTTRLTTVAMHPRYRNWQTDSLPCDLAMATDVQSYNYRYMYFPDDRSRFPWMTFYQSEASVAGMGPNFFGMDLDKVIGLAYWGGIDYLGESQGWPEKGWGNGIFDISLNPKPKAWLMRSMFKAEEPLVHVSVAESPKNRTWNGVQTGTYEMSECWNRAEGERLRVVAYTNADEVELFLNGKSLGKQQNQKNNPERRNQLVWNDVSYEPGILEAVASNIKNVGRAKTANSVVVARHRMETTGNAVRLIAKADTIEWKANGQDLQHVIITAVDDQGRHVWQANEELTFEVDGDARIVGVTNGDIASDEPNVAAKRRLWNGAAMVILRAGRKPSMVRLKVNGGNLGIVDVIMDCR